MNQDNLNQNNINNFNIQSNNGNKNKKIIIVIIISIILVIAIVVGVILGSKFADVEDKILNDNDNTNINDDIENNDSNNNSNINSENLKTTSIPGKNIYFSYDKSLKKKEEANSIVLYNSNDYLVSVTFKKDITYKESIDGVIDLLNRDFIVDASLSSRGDLYNTDKFTVNSKENIKVNNFNSVKFIGTLPNRTWNCYVYGYAFVIDDTPIMVIGLVSAQSQESEMIKNIQNNVESIIKTINVK